MTIETDFMHKIRNNKNFFSIFYFQMKIPWPACIHLNTVLIGSKPIIKQFSSKNNMKMSQIVSFYVIFPSNILVRLEPIITGFLDSSSDDSWYQIQIVRKSRKLPVDHCVTPSSCGRSAGDKRSQFATHTRQTRAQLTAAFVV